MGSASIRTFASPPHATCACCVFNVDNSAKERKEAQGGDSTAKGGATPCVGCRELRWGRARTQTTQYTTQIDSSHTQEVRLTSQYTRNHSTIRNTIVSFAPHLLRCSVFLVTLSCVCYYDGFYALLFSLLTFGYSAKGFGGSYHKTFFTS